MSGSPDAAAGCPQPLPSIRRVRERMASGNKDPQVCHLVPQDMDGGTTSIEDIAALDAFPEASLLQISGLTQAGLEYLVSRYPMRFSAIEFWKCRPLVDLSPIEALQSPTHLIFHDNNRARGLWDFRRTPALRALMFEDFTKLKDLSDLQRATMLTELEFGNAIWTRQTYDSLVPLAGLSSLESLRFDASNIADAQIRPLAALVNLRELAFPSKLFTQSQLAWLRAKLPHTVASEVLQACHPMAAMPTKSGRANDIQFTGRDQRRYDSTRDAAKIAQKVREYETLVERFAANPTAEPQ